MDSAAPAMLRWWHGQTLAPSLAPLALCQHHSAAPSHDSRLSPSSGRWPRCAGDKGTAAAREVAAVGAAEQNYPHHLNCCPGTHFICSRLWCEVSWVPAHAAPGAGTEPPLALTSLSKASPGTAPCLLSQRCWHRTCP